MKPRPGADPYAAVRHEVVADVDGVPVQLDFCFPLIEDDFPEGFDIDKALKEIYKAEKESLNQ